MTDHLDPTSAASAAFDGEATADERAIVEASDAFRDELRQYGALRAALRDVEVPAAARESAMSAALAAFDVEAGAPAIEPSPTSATLAPVVSLAARRQRQYRWLGAAAAAVVAVLVVGVIARSGGGDDKKTTLEAPSDGVAIPFGSAAKSEPAIEAAPVAGGAADAATAAATAETTAATTAESTGDSTAASTAGTTSSADTAAATSMSDAFANAPVLDTEDQLVAFASGLTTPISPTPVALTSAGETATTAAPSPAASTTMDAASTSTVLAPSASVAPDCTAVSLEPAGPAIYQGRPVYVVRDGAAGQIVVIDAATCTITTVIPFPAP